MFNDVNKRVDDPIGWLIDTAKEMGLEYIFSRYHGVYRGIVVDNSDPEGRGRVRVLIPSIGHETEDDVSENIWALPCQNGLSIGNSNEVHGLLYIPDVGDQVFIMFENGISTEPIYLGGWLHSELVSKNSFTNSSVKSIRTKSGHLIQFDDSEGVVKIEHGSDGALTGNSIVISNGKVNINTSGGFNAVLDQEKVQLIASDETKINVKDNNVLIENSSSKIEMNGSDVNISAVNINMEASNIKIKGQVELGLGPIYESAITGDSFTNTVFLPHVHGAVPLVLNGTTIPGTAQPIPTVANGLSTSVKVSK